MIWKSNVFRLGVFIYPLHWIQERFFLGGDGGCFPFFLWMVGRFWWMRSIGLVSFVCVYIYIYIYIYIRLMSSACSCRWGYFVSSSFRRILHFLHPKDLYLHRNMSSRLFTLSNAITTQKRTNGKMKKGRRKKKGMSCLWMCKYVRNFLGYMKEYINLFIWMHYIYLYI